MTTFLPLAISHLSFAAADGPAIVILSKVVLLKRRDFESLEPWIVPAEIAVGVVRVRVLPGQFSLEQVNNAIADCFSSADLVDLFGDECFRR